MAASNKPNPQTKANHNLCGNVCPHKDRHIVFSRSPRDVSIYLFFFLIASYLTVKLSRQFPITLLNVELEMFGNHFLITMPVLGLFLAIILARPLILLFNERHEICCHHLFSVSGLFSLHKREIKIPYETLLGVHVQQSVRDRILGVGTVLVGTAMVDLPEIALPGISSPDYVAAAITDRIDLARKRRGALPEIGMP